MFDFACRKFRVAVDPNVGTKWGEFYTDFIQKQKEEQENLYNLFRMCEKVGRITEDTELSYEEEDARQVIDKIERIMTDCRELVMNCVTAKLNMNNETSRNIKKSAPLRWIQTGVTDETRDNGQNVILYIVKDLERKGLRKKDGNVYSQLYVDGFPTGYWKEMCTIAQYISQQCTEINYNVWKMLTSSRDRTREIAEYISTSVQPRVKEVEVDRFRVVFNDGIYMMDQDMFYYFRDRPHWARIAEQINEQRKQLKQQLASRGKKLSIEDAVPPDESRAAMTYFEQPFKAWDASVRCMDLPTPDTDQILKDQHLNEDTMEWFYAFTGRLWYPLGRLDNWQCAKAIVGVAKNGKSTWCRIVRRVIPDDKTKNMSGKPEEVFGIASFADAYLCIVSEMKKEFAKSFNTADFQCMITGEEVAYARKNKDAVTKKWTTNFLLCGNESADWASTSGSMERRIMPFEWPYRLKKADTRLYDRIMRNMGPFIRKANCCYYTKVTLYEDVDITGDTHVLTQQMNLFLEKMKRQVNKFLAFLCEQKESLTYRVDEGAYMPLDTLRKDYFRWRKQRSSLRYRGKTSTSPPSRTWAPS